MKKIILLLILFNACNNLFATHNRGGRIEVSHLNGLTYQITVITYTKTSSSQANRPQLDSVYLGDSNIPIIFQRVDSLSLILSGDISINYYIQTHTYPGNGFYKVHFTDPNRSANILNIPNSVSIPFYIETTFTINQTGCPDNSPHLYTYPIFITPLGKDFILSRTASDGNWDSLSFELDQCLGNNGGIIVGYSIPPGISVDPKSGEFKWIGSSMQVAGEYNFAIRIKEWRNGNLFGYLHEDFQVILDPSIGTFFNFNTTALPIDLTSHILPGSNFTLQVDYFDQINSPNIQFYFDLSLDTSSFVITGNNYLGYFTFAPTINDVRADPYRLQFRGNADLTYLIYVDSTSVYNCRSLVGIDELAFQDKFILYPNPVSENLFIEGGDLNNILHYSIFNVQGQEMKNSIVDRNQIYVSDLMAGIYFIEIDSKDYKERKKIIVMH